MVDRGEPLPDWHAFDGIIAMGGPMGAYEDDRLPWLADEKRLIADAVSAGTAVWGVCLGAQLPAASLGASVPRPVAEVGVLPVYRTDAGASDPCSRQCPMKSRCAVARRHVALPAGGVQRRDDAYEQRRSWSTAPTDSVHIEVGTALAAEWGEVPEYAQSLEAFMGERALPRLLDQIAAAEDEEASPARCSRPGSSVSLVPALDVRVTAPVSVNQPAALSATAASTSSALLSAGRPSANTSTSSRPTRTACPAAIAASSTSQVPSP